MLIVKTPEKQASKQAIRKKEADFALVKTIKIEKNSTISSACVECEISDVQFIASNKITFK